MSIVLRLGKFVENAQAALRAIAAPGETGERITTIGRQLGYFGYLFLDNIAWVSYHCDHQYNCAELASVGAVGEHDQVLQLEADNRPEDQQACNAVLVHWNLVQHYPWPLEGSLQTPFSGDMMLHDADSQYSGGQVG